MLAYIVRRLLLIIPTVFLVTIIVFFTVRLIPGNIVDMIVSQQQHVTLMDRAAIEHELGLDVPSYIQYGRWMERIILHGDLGNSLLKGTPVFDEIIRRFPVSLELGILAVMIGLIIALPIGIYSAIRQDTVGDYIARSFAICCIALPSFWIGTMVVVFPSIWWSWSPSIEYIPFFKNPIGNLVQFIIPAAILGMTLSGITMRMTRTMMLEVLRQDYVKTAWAKGLRERTIVIRHAMRNALIPVVTIIGLQLPVTISGSVVLEQIFSLPGIGSLVIETLTVRDYTVLSGINLFAAVGVLFLNLATDLTYSYLDPRIRYR